jgi:hypothetical protein
MALTTRYALLCVPLLAACATQVAPPPIASPPSAKQDEIAPPGPKVAQAPLAPSPKSPEHDAPASPAISQPRTAPSPAQPVKPKAPAPAQAPAKPQPAAPAQSQARPEVPTPVAAAPAPLDLKSLEQRLKDTSAIGVLTKLSLKNQVDDLVGRFQAYHKGVRPPTLADLRPAFDLLLMKVLSLLQDHDPALARDINASRDAIWGVLTDPRKLAQFA